MTTIVFIPGLLCDESLYAPQIAGLGDRAVQIADTRSDDTISGMAERLLGDGPDRMVLVGLSMGGMVAMEAMVRAPGRIAGALLLDTDPTAARPREIAWREALMEQVGRDGLAPFIADFAPRFFSHSDAARERLLPGVEEMMGAMSADVFLRQSAALNTRSDLRETLSHCPVRTVLMCGTEDRICPPLLHEALAGAMPDIRYEPIPATGHLATIETPDPVNRALAALLAGVAASA